MDLYGFTKRPPAPQYDGYNNHYYNDNWTSSSDTKWWVWMLWIAGGAFVLIALSVFIWKYCIRRRKEKDVQKSGTVFVSEQKVE